MYQLFADPNVSSTLAKPPPFSPPKYAVWVNSLWFLSLVISLTCALLATLLQQWARRYLKITQLPRYSPHKRARIREFFADGVEKFHLPEAVGVLPTLLHLSLFLFFSGLLIFLFNINHTVFSVVVWWVGFSAGIYACITFLPIFRPESPYYAPLSSPVWFLYTGIPYVTFRIFWLLKYHLGSLPGELTLPLLTRSIVAYRKRLMDGIVKTAQETASKLSVDIDGRILKWTFDAVDEDHELEQFLEGIPGLCSSKVVVNPQHSLAKLGEWSLSSALMGFSDRTLSSNLVPESVKIQRLVICLNAANAAGFPDAVQDILRDILRDTLSGRCRGVLESVEMGHLLGRWRNSSDKKSAICSQSIVAGIIANVRERDDRWATLAMGQLGVLKGVFRGYLTYSGDSVLLANLIHITRQIFRSYLRGDRHLAYLSSGILPSISKFSIQTALPGLQDDFCALWNEIVLEAGKSGAYSTPTYILRNIRHLYIDLHQDSDIAQTAFTSSIGNFGPILSRPSSYPLCKIPGHRSHIQGGLAGAPGESGQASVATSPTIPHPNAVPAILTPSARHNKSTSPALTPDHSRIQLIAEQSPHDVLPTQATPVAESSYSALPVSAENYCRDAASLDPATAIVTRGAADDTTTLSATVNSPSDPLSALATLTPVLQPTIVPLSSSTVAPQCVADLMPGAPPPNNTLPANLGSSLASVSQIHPVTSCVESFPSASATAISLTPLQATSVSSSKMVPNGEALDTHDDLPDPTETPYPHQQALFVVDLATDISRRSLDTVPSTRDIDRPQ